MRQITECNVLLRGSIELPDDVILATEEFREGWNLVLSGDSHWLDKKIRTRGWHFIWIAEGHLKGGVGKTAQEAIAGALKLALRRVGACFNAAEVEHIELKKYPWFVLARVRVYPYQIQRTAFLLVPAKTTSIPMPPPEATTAIKGVPTPAAV